ncbi:MAG: hypothetical protein ABI583_07815 [Betaproteobacteria bacterium]
MRSRTPSYAYVFFRLAAIISAAATLSLMFTIVRASEPTTAQELPRAVALGPTSTDQFVFSVHPMLAKPGQPRVIFFHSLISGCPTMSLDTSQAESQNRLIIANGWAGISNAICSPAYYIRAFQYTPTKSGTITVYSQATLLQVTIQTVSTTVSSKFDVSGMWFDPATSGSGISLHHSRSTTDSAFGTWFLFNNYRGTPLWYSLQSTAWTQDGSVLEGLLYFVNGTCADSQLNGCPGVGSINPPSPPFTYPYWVTPSLARITFQSPTRARAEVLTLWGTVIFTSELTKLQF